MTADEVVNVALHEWELGYYAKHNKADINDRLGGTPHKPEDGDYYRHTLYAQELYDYGYYNGNKSGWAWCTIFCDWCFLKAANYDKNIATSVKPPNAGVTGVLSTAEKLGALITKDDILNGRATAMPGDIALIENNGNADDGPDHVGVIVKVEGVGKNQVVYAVEGNTGGSSYSARTVIKPSSDPYAGVNYDSAVYQKKMPVSGKYIHPKAFYRPNYSSAPAPTPTKYDITINNINHLTVSCPSSGYIGDIINLTATPESSYTVNTLVISVNGRPLTLVKSGVSYTGSFTLDGITNISVTGEIVKEEYSISVIQLSNTTMTCSKTRGGYNESISVTLSPNVGYIINNPVIKVNGSAISITKSDNSYTGTFKLTKDTSVTASGNVTQATANINVVPLISNIDIVCPTSGRVGDTITIGITPRAHYSVMNVRVLINGEEIRMTESSGSYTGTFTLTKDTELTVNGYVAPNACYISSRVPQNAVLDCVQFSSYGATVSLTAYAETGYILVNPTVTAGGVNVPLTQEGNEYHGSFVVLDSCEVILAGEVIEETKPSYQIQATSPEHTIVTIPKFGYEYDNITVKISGEENYLINNVELIVNEEIIPTYKEGDIYIGQYTLTQDSQVQVHCDVTPKVFTIDVQSPDAIEVNCPTSGVYGEVITVSMSPKEHYVVDNVEVSVNGDIQPVVEMSCSFVLEKNTLVYISGTINPTRFSITASAEQGITLNCPTEGQFNDEITVEFYADTGYVIKNPALVVNGDEVQLSTAGDKYIGRFILTKDTQVICSGNITKGTFSINVQQLKNVIIICKSSAQVNEQVPVQFYAEDSYILTNPSLMINGRSVEVSKDGKVYSGSFVITEDVTVAVIGEVVPDTGDISTQICFSQNGTWSGWMDIQDCITPSYTNKGTYTIIFKVRYYDKMEDKIVKEFPENEDHYEIPFIIN